MPKYILNFFNVADQKEENINHEFESLDEAVNFGQNSGNDYEIFDIKNILIIDWNQINMPVTDERFFYDDSELIWKKSIADDKPTQP
jgi:hypothetical protein